MFGLSGWEEKGPRAMARRSRDGLIKSCTCRRGGPLARAQKGGVVTCVWGWKSQPVGRSGLALHCHLTVSRDGRQGALGLCADEANLLNFGLFILENTNVFIPLCIVCPQTKRRENPLPIIAYPRPPIFSHRKKKILQYVRLIRFRRGGCPFSDTSVCWTAVSVGLLRFRKNLSRVHYYFGYKEAPEELQCSEISMRMDHMVSTRTSSVSDILTTNLQNP